MPANFTNKNSAGLFSSGSLPLLISIVAVAFVIATTTVTARFGTTAHLDGLYQTYSALSRLASGEALGRDFFSYLGVGPILALFQPFVLSGGTLFASNFAAGMAAALGFGALISASAWAALRALGMRSMLPSALVIGAALLLSRYYWEAALVASSPGNSLLPWRAAIPALMLPLFTLTLRQNGWRLLLASALSGIALMWSNDFAIPTFLAWHGCLLVVHARRSNFWWAALGMVGGIFLYIVLLTLVTMGHPLEVVAFNRDVAADQYWYFAPYSEAFKILTPADALRLPSMLTEETRPFVYLYPPALIVLAIMARKYEALAPMLFLAAAAFGGGLLPSVGGTPSAHYFMAATFISPFLILAFVGHFIRRARPSSATLQLAILAVVIVPIAIGIGEGGRRMTLDAAAQRNSQVFVRELGTYVVPWEKLDIDQARGIRKEVDAGTTVLSSYFNAVNAIAKPPPVADVDAYIHALGPERRNAFAEAARNVDIVVTTNPVSNAIWTSWGVTQNWAFYRNLVVNFAPSSIGTTQVIWRRRGEALRMSEFVPCAVQHGYAGDRLFFARSSDVTMLDVHLETHRERSAPWPVRPMTIVALPASPYLIWNTLSVSPLEDTATFPAILMPGDDHVEITGVPSTSRLRVVRCSYRKVPIDAETLRSVLPSP